MTTRVDSDIFAALADLNLHLEGSEPADDVSSKSDTDEISAVLLESINKAQETNKCEFAPEDIAFVDSCLTFNSEDDWEFMKMVLLDTLNTSNSGSDQSPDLHLDDDMLHRRESDEENAEEMESREDIFGIWNLDLEDGSDEEIGLIKDLKKLLSSDTGTSTDTSSVTGTAEQEGLNLELGGHTENIENLVADLGNLSLNPVEGWNDKISS